MRANNTLYAPISIYDIQSLFNVRLTKSGEDPKYSNDLGTIISGRVGQTIDGWTVASREQINKWAKHKPVVIAGDKTVITDAQKAGVNYGIINIPIWTRLDRMGNYWFDGSTSSTDLPSCGMIVPEDCWKYNIPSGTNSAPFRLTDFIMASNTLKGYYHNAPDQISDIYTTDYDNQDVKIIYIDPHGHMRLNWGPGGHTAEQNDDMILYYSDFYNSNTSLAQYHFGTMIERTTINTTKYVMVDDKVMRANNSDPSVYTNGPVLDVYFDSVAEINSFFTSSQYSSPDSQLFYITPIMAANTTYDLAQDQQHHKFTTSSLSTSNTCLTIHPVETIRIAKKYAKVDISNLGANKDLLDTRYCEYGFMITSEEIDIARTISIHIYILDSNDNVLNDGILTETLGGSSPASKHITGRLYGGQYASSMNKFKVVTTFTTTQGLILVDEDEKTTIIQNSPTPQT